MHPSRQSFLRGIAASTALVPIGASGMPIREINEVPARSTVFRCSAVGGAWHDVQTAAGGEFTLSQALARPGSNVQIVNHGSVWLMVRGVARDSGTRRVAPGETLELRT